MTPTEFLIDALSKEDVDEVHDMVLIRRHKNGSVSYRSASESNFEVYSMVVLTKALVEVDFVQQVHE